MGYEGTYIYIYQYDYMFQYLFAWKDEIYQQHMFLVPVLWRRIASQLGIVPKYTQEHLEDGEKIILTAAIDSIDALKKAPKEKKREFAAQRQAKKDNDCMWQTQEIMNKGVPENIYYCITHNEYAPMVKGKRPDHYA